MKRVVWHNDAIQQMDAIVRFHPDSRKRIRLALRRMNDVLSVNPEASGESREPSRRVFVEKPLTFFYKIIDDGVHIVVMSVNFFE